ncbi:RNA methyltransferase [Pirellulaceae bacterium]|jgi:tRNA G18 (ribose-2'-O)-methylase SpoU|nr:RNA methyltransferase [Pirellulaceae bacterium]
MLDPNEQLFLHERHKPLEKLPTNRELLVVVPQLRSNVNLSRIARAAGCCGVKKMIIEGNAKIDRKIARDASETIEFERRQSLPPTLKRLKSDGYVLVGLEQTTNSTRIYDYPFPKRMALVIGHERNGITNDVLGLLDATIEIPVFGLPFSYNAATATAMALYEYCRQALTNPSD